MIAVLGVARKRSVDMEAAIPEDICGGGGFCVGIRGDIGGEVEKVLTIDEEIGVPKLDTLNECVVPLALWLVTLGPD